jgi:hypothetical protein
MIHQNLIVRFNSHPPLGLSQSVVVAGRDLNDMAGRNEENS